MRAVPMTAFGKGPRQAVLQIGRMDRLCLGLLAVALKYETPIIHESKLDSLPGEILYQLKVEELVPWPSLFASTGAIEFIVNEGWAEMQKHQGRDAALVTEKGRDAVEMHLAGGGDFEPW